jgi:hypothetical protein
MIAAITSKGFGSGFSFTECFIFEIALRLAVIWAEYCEMPIYR